MKTTIKALRNVHFGILALAMFAGCSDDSKDPGGPQPPPGGDAYLAVSRVFTPGGTQTASYLHVVSSLEASTTVDPRKAIEIAGSARLFSNDDGSWFAIGAGEQPTITRYTLSASNELVKGGSVGLSGVGVRSLWWDTLYHVSSTKAYYPDPVGHQLIVVNLADMTLGRPVPLPQTARESHLTTHYSYTPILRGGKLLFSVGWFDWRPESDKIVPETGLVVVDTATDTVERYDVDPRCAGITRNVETDSGDTYFVASAMAAADHLLNRLPTKPCALRIKAGADKFDPDYSLDLGTLTAGAPAGEPAPGGGKNIYLRVLDRTRITVKDDTKSWDLTAEGAWQWWSWNTESGTAAPIPDLPASSSNGSPFVIGGRIYGTETTEGNGETTLIDLTAQGGPKRMLRVPGFLSGLVKIR